MMARLGDICDVRDGTHDSPPYVAEGYPLVTSKNIVDGKLDMSDISYISLEDYNKINERSKVSTGDIIMPMIGTIGNPYIIEEFTDFAIKNVALIKFPNDIVYNKYIFHFLNSEKFKKYIVENNRGGTQKFLSLKDIRNIQLNLPSLAEQMDVVEKLDKVCDLISIRNKQLSKLDELVKSRFIEMFGSIHSNKFNYDIVTLQDVSEPIKDGTHQTPTYTEDTVNGFKFLSSKDVTTGAIDWSHLKYITEDLHQELYSRLAPRKGDILLAKNGTTGIAAVVDRDEIFDIYVSLALIRPLGINSTYLWAAINSAETKQQFDASLKGIGVPNLHLGEIKKARIILPPMELQVQFASFVKQTDKSKFEIQQSLEKLETLKKALMQKYFG